jgi:hypothetical protein
MSVLTVVPHPTLHAPLLSQAAATPMHHMVACKGRTTTQQVWPSRNCGLPGHVHYSVKPLGKAKRTARPNRPRVHVRHATSAAPCARASEQQHCTARTSTMLSTAAAQHLPACSSVWRRFLLEDCGLAGDPSACSAGCSAQHAGASTLQGGCWVAQHRGGAATLQGGC